MVEDIDFDSERGTVAECLRDYSNAVVLCGHVHRASAAGHYGRPLRYRVEMTNGEKVLLTRYVAQDKYFRPLKLLPKTQDCVFASSVFCENGSSTASHYTAYVRHN